MKVRMFVPLFAMLGASPLGDCQITDDRDTALDGGAHCVGDCVETWQECRIGCPGEGGPCESACEDALRFCEDRCL